uniref:Uncharacterized protein n=1 Tax=Anguilla anguilla TaxID=7936 RepID=A0A0E9SHK6_ANGAN
MECSRGKAVLCPSGLYRALPQS